MISTVDVAISDAGTSYGVDAILTVTLPQYFLDNWQYIELFADQRIPNWN